MFSICRRGGVVDEVNLINSREKSLSFIMLNIKIYFIFLFYMSTKFGKITQLQKNDVIDIIKELPIEDIREIFNNFDKDMLVLTLKNSFTKNQLRDIIYNSKITEEQIVGFVYSKIVRCDITEK